MRDANGGVAVGAAPALITSAALLEQRKRRVAHASPLDAARAVVRTAARSSVQNPANAFGPLALKNGVGRSINVSYVVESAEGAMRAAGVGYHTRVTLIGRREGSSRGEHSRRDDDELGDDAAHECVRI